MKQYMLSVHHDPTFYEGDAPEMSPEEMQAMYEGVAAFNEEAIAAGAMVFGGGLMPPDTATVVRTENGEVPLTDWAERRHFARAPAAFDALPRVALAQARARHAAGDTDAAL